MDVAAKTDADGIKRAYVASQEFGFSVIDVSSATAPVIENISDKLFSGEYIAASGALAVVTGKLPGETTKRLWAAKLNNAARPFVVGELTTSGTLVINDVALHIKGSATDITMAVVAAGSQGIKVIDLTNCMNLTSPPITPIVPPVIGTYDTSGNAYAVALNSTGTIAYVADGNGLRIVSLSNPRAPSLLASLSIGSVLTDVAVSGNIVCLGDQNGSGLWVVNASNPSAPVLLSLSTLLGLSYRVAMDPQDPTTVAVLSSSYSAGDQLEIFNLSIPSQPVREGYVKVAPCGYGEGVTLDNGFSYVTVTGEGLKRYNILTAIPSLTNTVDIPGDAYDVAVNNSYAYVTGFPAALCIIQLP